MAQRIHCDYTGCGRLADVMTSRLADGDTTAWCFEHYVAVCQAVVAEAQAAEERRPLPAPDNPLAEGVAEELERQADDIHAVRALADVHPPEATWPGTSAVVPRGQSPSRRAFEARRRAKREPSAVSHGEDGSEAPSAAPELTDAISDSPSV